MRAPDEINHYRYDEDGLMMDPLAPVAWDSSWDAYGDAPLPGLDAFGPITREDLTPHDGERGIELALYQLLGSERRRRSGWSMLWINDYARTGRCAGIQFRAFDDEGGKRTVATLEASFKRLGFMVKRFRPKPVDPETYRRTERIA